MEASQFDEHAGEHQPDAAGTETGPVLPPEPASNADVADHETEADERAEVEAPVVDSPDEDHPEVPADEETDDDREGGHKVGGHKVGDEEPGILTGTAAELAPGVGGAGEHPAPAAVRGVDGSLHVAGEPPAGTIAKSEAGSDLRDTPSGATEQEARERLNAEQEPEQIETKRPDLGTE